MFSYQTLNKPERSLINKNPTVILSYYEESFITQIADVRRKILRFLRMTKN